jgi:hypothetical protein
MTNNPLLFGISELSLYQGSSYFNRSLFTYDGISPGVIGKTSAEMTNQSFVSDFLNPGIETWHSTHTGYDDYKYIYHPANYPTIQKY